MSKDFTIERPIWQLLGAPYTSDHLTFTNEPQTDHFKSFALNSRIQDQTIETIASAEKLGLQKIANAASIDECLGATITHYTNMANTLSEAAADSSIFQNMPEQFANTRIQRGGQNSYHVSRTVDRLIPNAQKGRQAILSVNVLGKIFPNSDKITPRKVPTAMGRIFDQLNRQIDTMLKPIDNAIKGITLNPYAEPPEQSTIDLIAPENSKMAADYMKMAKSYLDEAASITKEWQTNVTPEQSPDQSTGQVR